MKPVRTQVNEHVWTHVYSQVDIQVQDQVRYRVWDEVYRQVDFRVWNRVLAKVLKKARTEP